jgi:GT2 family glycosyltransferase
MMHTALVIPSLGASSLDKCLRSVRKLDPPPAEIVVVLSGARGGLSFDDDVKCLSFANRLGFAAAANAGIHEVWQRAQAVALVNDDAFPDPDWLGRLEKVLAGDPGVAAVQGSVNNATGETVDGRGIALSRWGLPLQVDRGTPAATEPARSTQRTAVSATAALYRSHALREISLPSGAVFDPSFDSYHEDVDVGLRLARSGWKSCWIPDARCRHLGSASGASHGWRHPWWLLANPWRVISGNLGPWPTIRATPRAALGELRAAARMSRDNPRTPLVAAAVFATLPFLVVSGWMRSTPGPRLAELPAES